MKRRRVLAYCRVSSRSQNLAMQRAAILREARARGLTIWRWFEDKTTGKTSARPGLDDLRRVATSLERESIVIIYRLDRLTRAGIRDTLTVIEELRRHGIQIISCADAFSLDGPASDVVIAVMAWAAQMERLAISERISSARERIEREGGAWGRPRRMNAQQIAAFHLMRRSGRSLRSCAVALKIPRSTLARARFPSQKPTTIRRPRHG